MSIHSLIARAALPGICIDASTIQMTSAPSAQYAGRGCSDGRLQRGRAVLTIHRSSGRQAHSETKSSWTPLIIHEVADAATGGA